MRALMGERRQECPGLVTEPHICRQFNVGAQTDLEPEGLGLLGTNPHSTAYKLCDLRQAILNLFLHLQNGDNNVTCLVGLL